MGYMTVYRQPGLQKRIVLKKIKGREESLKRRKEGREKRKEEREMFQTHKTMIRAI